MAGAAVIRFMAGAAVIVALQQLKSLLGITHFTKQMTIIPVMSSVFRNIHEVNYSFIIISCSLSHTYMNLIHPFPLYIVLFFKIWVFVGVLQWSWQTIVMRISFLVLLLRTSKTRCMLWSLFFGNRTLFCLAL